MYFSRLTDHGRITLVFLTLSNINYNYVQGLSSIWHKTHDKLTKMGKTKLFSRPRSKTSSIYGVNDHEDLQQEKRSRNQSRSESRNSKPKTNHESFRYSEEKLKRRKQIDKAKQLAENTNSLRRRKKHETAKTMAQNIPREIMKESISHEYVDEPTNDNGIDYKMKC